MKTLIVKFVEPYRNNPTSRTDKDYHYLYDGDRNVKAKDFGVVHNGFECRIVKIESVFEGVSPLAKKYVVEVLDMDAYAERNMKAIERQAVLARLTEIEKNQAELDRFKQLAATNEEAAELMKKLEELS